MTTQLAQLKRYTQVVADTGDIDAIANCQPLDATTNPSLLLKAASSPAYQPLIQQACDWAKQQSNNPSTQLRLSCDYLAVLAGQQILSHIPGRISTEVDARLSFDTQATIEKARLLIHMYNSLGISSDRVLIKIAATWEGICAAQLLEQEDIQCNLTLLFSFAQAQACAEAGVFLISPFVGRILDWYQANTDEHYHSETDPGVLSVKRIYRYYKQHNYKTIVMGASFRNIGQIQSLAGCDRLTISPALLAELEQNNNELTPQLSPQDASQDEKECLSEAAFRWQMNQDEMAHTKLAEGIRAFAADQEKLEAILSDALKN